MLQRLLLEQGTRDPFMTSHCPPLLENIFIDLVSYSINIQLQVNYFNILIYDINNYVYLVVFIVFGEATYVFLWFQVRL